MEPLPAPDPAGGPDPGSMAVRTRAARRDRRHVRILHEKGAEERAAIEPGVPGLSTSFFETAGGLFAFFGRFVARVWRRPFEWRELLNQMDEVGSKSLTLTAVVGLSIGIVLAMQSRGTLARFGAESMLPSMLALSVIKEIGPVLTSIVLAGRLGAGFASELGSMKVTEQIDALEVAALKPFHYLVVTRVLACALMFPVMTALTDMIALTGGYMESSLSEGTDYRVFMDTALSSLRFADIIIDTGKMVIFGLIVGIVSCWLGYNVRGGTREVGQAAMQAVVLSSLLVLVADVMIVRVTIMLFGDVSAGG